MQQCVISILIKKYIILSSKLQNFIFLVIASIIGKFKKVINLQFLELSFM